MSTGYFTVFITLLCLASGPNMVFAETDKLAGKKHLLEPVSIFLSTSPKPGFKIISYWTCAVSNPISVSFQYTKGPIKIFFVKLALIVLLNSSSKKNTSYLLTISYCAYTFD